MAHVMVPPLVMVLGTVVVVLVPDVPAVPVLPLPLLPQAANTSEPAASAAPIFKAGRSLSFSFRCIWPLFLLSLNDAVGIGERSPPFSENHSPSQCSASVTFRGVLISNRRESRC